MGPLLNVFLLSQKMSNQQVGTTFTERLATAADADDDAADDDTPPLTRGTPPNRTARPNRAASPRSQFVGTRATFFSCANTIKLLLRIYEGSLSLEMLKLGFSLSLISVLGVFVSKLIVKVRRDAQARHAARRHAARRHEQRAATRDVHPDDCMRGYQRSSSVCRAASRRGPRSS